MAKVTSLEFQRNFGRYQDLALSEPVIVTRNGRERTVVLSAEEYRRLKQNDRRVFGVEELTDDELAAIARARVPSEHSALDDELKDWRQ